jgi:UDP-GlcNAc:undecaprenyl-phosphate GlcNAc-1-phosphate transferase
MIALFLLANFALLVALMWTPLCRNAATALGLVDRPDNARKFHKVAVPRIGGVAIFIALAATCCAMILLERLAPPPVRHQLRLVMSLAPAVSLIFLVGLADDIFHLKPWQKLVGQIAAAGFVCWSGVLVRSVAWHVIPGWWAYPITIVWLVGCTNAINLIDGIDGLAAGVGLFASVTTFVAALLSGDRGLQLAVVPLIGALLGFLLFNFNPASIFLGDCGSLTIGFLLGCYGIVWSQKAPTLLGMTAPLIALAIPLLDTGLAIARRLLRGQPIFGADRGHIHHRLLDRGLTPRRVALLLYTLCGVAAALALVLDLANGRFEGLIVVVFCIAAWIGVQRLGYAEFNMAGRMVRLRTFQGVLNAQLQLGGLEEALRAANTVEECFAAARETAFVLGFTQISMRMDHTVMEAHRPGHLVEEAWSLSVPLSSEGFVRLSHSFDSTGPPMVIGSLAQLLRRALVPKLSMFQPGAKPAPEALCPGAERARSAA